MIRLILELIAIYFLYKLIFEFIIPIYQSTRHIKDQVNEAQRRMNDFARQQQQRAPKRPASSSPSASRKKEDYIDFEEVK